MQVGYNAILQNPGQEISDAEMYRQELRLSRMVEGLGFDAIWTTEHHFSGYQNCPDSLQFLSYIAGATEKLKLGAGCVVLPWHNPLRVAEQAIALDHHSNGRLVLGLARGASADEFDGFQVDMNVTRPLFIEYASAVLAALESGYFEYDGEYLKQKRVRLRPEPLRSFKGRVYCGSVSPESMEITARLGMGVLITPSKPWDVVHGEMQDYHQHYRNYHGADPVPTMANAWVFCDEDEARAKELGAQYIKAYWNTVLDHYGFNKPEKFAGKKGYEHYAKGAEAQAKMKADDIAQAFLEMHVYGTPEQCYEKILHIRNKVACNAFTGVFRYADMPYEEAERNLRLFASAVLPELKKLPEPKTFGALPDAKRTAASA